MKIIGPYDINQLLADEKERLRNTAHTNAITVIAKMKGKDDYAEAGLVHLLTEEKFIALKCVNRSYNECIVESAFPMSINWFHCTMGHSLQLV